MTNKAVTQKNLFDVITSSKEFMKKKKNNNIINNNNDTNIYAEIKFSFIVKMCIYCVCVLSKEMSKTNLRPGSNFNELLNHKYRLQFSRLAELSEIPLTNGTRVTVFWLVRLDFFVLGLFLCFERVL